MSAETIEGAEDGATIGEFDQARAEAAVRELLIAHGYQSVTTASDLGGHPRVTGGQAP